MGYKTACICLNGHIISGNIDDYNDKSEYCSICGEKTFTSCQKCNTKIKGDYDYDIWYDTLQFIPYYCSSCGEPFPWTEKILNNAIELVSLDDGLSEEEKKILKNVFPDLIVETPTTPVAIAKYKKYSKKAQDFIKDGLKILLINVVGETVKKQIWG